MPATSHSTSDLYVHAEHAEPLHAPPPLLRRMTAAGLLGRKTRRGFYEYSDQPGDGAGR
jgi:3-hydroxyacyl-CoA dehydrogenase